MNFKYYKTGPLIGLIALLSLLGGLANLWLGTISKPGSFWSQVIDVLGIGSIVFLTTIVVFVINNWGWSWKIKSWKVFAWLVDLPDLRGRYIGTLISSYEENGQRKEMKCVIEITQTGSAVKLSSYYFDPGTNGHSSTSTSILEEILRDANGLFRIHYFFTNKPGTHQEQLIDHDGTAWILYYPDVKKIEMEYYNKKGNKGSASLVFEQKELLGRFEK